MSELENLRSVLEVGQKAVNMDHAKRLSREYAEEANKQFIIGVNQKK